MCGIMDLALCTRLSYIHPPRQAPFKKKGRDNAQRVHKQLYCSLGVNRDDKTGRLDMAKRNFQFFNAPVGLLITIDRRLGPCQWADLGGYVSTLALLARGYGLDSCPQVMWIRVHKVVRAILKIPPDVRIESHFQIG